MFIVLFGLGIMSCERKDKNEDNYFLEFRPRKCNYIFAVPGYIEKTVYQGNTYFDYRFYSETNFFPAQDFFLNIETHNLNIEELFSEFEDAYSEIILNLDEPIPDLETQIELDYRKKSASSSMYLKSAVDYTAMIEMEYRIDGVRNFKISALDKLFDQEPGTSLNEYFKIIRYDPDFIASSDTYNLLYGFSDKDKPEDIDEWLNLSPLAPALMYVAFREVPEDLPESIRFVVEMETDKGKVLRDTSQVIQFNR
jgi:hypothetical protein